MTALDSEPLRAGGRAKYMFFFGKLLFSQVSTRQEKTRGLSVYFSRARARVSVSRARRTLYRTSRRSRVSSRRALSRPCPPWGRDAGDTCHECARHRSPQITATRHRTPRRSGSTRHAPRARPAGPHATATRRTDIDRHNRPSTRLRAPLCALSDAACAQLSIVHTEHTGSYITGALMSILPRHRLAVR